MIEAVVWDLGGVLCHFDPIARQREIARQSGTSEARVNQVLSVHVRAALDRGELTANQLLHLVRTQLDWQCAYEDLTRAWAHAFPPNTAVQQLAKRLRVPTALLSNNGPPVSDNLASVAPAVLAVTDRQIFSSNIGKSKPDPWAFLTACGTLGVAPKSALVIDDNPTNVQAAYDTGLQAIVFKNAETLERDLSSRSLLSDTPRPDRTHQPATARPPTGSEA